MIKKLRVQRFKQFGQETIELRPEGISLIAGGNNAGKSTILQALAVWEFCRTAIQMERSVTAFHQGSHIQGLGLGDDEFSPVSIPSLKHLWTNLRTQKTPADADGYTLRIACYWDDASGPDRMLEFGLALANDRLFVRVTDSNLAPDAHIPVMAYLPPFAGITDRETKVSLAIRRRRIGEGLAGAVLRNVLLDMESANVAARTAMRAGRTKISDADLRRLRQSDPWELLQQTLRTTFGAELIVEPFREEYHSYIRVEIVKGDVEGFQLKRYPNYNKRDLMVEGSGFLQWLSVFALATSPDVDVLLLDEPDAHLHPTLQAQLMDQLATLSQARGKQILVATHSAELLRHWQSDRILQVRSRSPKTRYLAFDHQKTGLLAGLGSDYAPRIDPIRRAGRVLFIEGVTDESVLRTIARKMGTTELDHWPLWITSRGQKERKLLFRALEEDFPGLVAVSLRDRDDEALSTTNSQLDDLNHPQQANFTALKWRRRHLENYLIAPKAIAQTTGRPETDVRLVLADDHGLAIGETFAHSDCPDALQLADGKGIMQTSASALLTGSGKTVADVAASLTSEEICEDFKTFFQRLSSIRTTGQ